MNNVCNDCDYYDIATCVCDKDGTLKNPQAIACDEYEDTILYGGCKNCRHSYSPQKWDYSKGGCEHTEMEGHVCMLFADEGKAIWQVGADYGMCEGYAPREGVCSGVKSERSCSLNGA